MSTEHWLTLAGILLTLITTLSAGFIGYGRLQQGQKDLKGDLERHTIVTDANFGKVQISLEATARTMAQISEFTAVQAANYKAMVEMAAERHTAIAVQVDELYGVGKQQGHRIHTTELQLAEIKGEVSKLKSDVVDLKEYLRNKGAA